jgi:hypothetical protein
MIVFFFLLGKLLSADHKIRLLALSHERKGVVAPREKKTIKKQGSPPLPERASSIECTHARSQSPAADDARSKASLHMGVIYSWVSQHVHEASVYYYYFLSVLLLCLSSPSIKVEQMVT